MALRSRPDHYGTIAIIIHWLSALLLFVLLGSGFSTALADNLTDKGDVLSVHAPIGISMLALTLIRIFWWLLADKKPEPVGGMDKMQEIAAKWLHIAFYVFIIGMASSGIGMMVLSGAREILAAGTPELLPDFWDYPPRWAHAIGARMLVVLIIAHVGAALYHHFEKQDGLLRRMWW